MTHADDVVGVITVRGTPRFTDADGAPVRLSPQALRSVPADTAGQARYPVGMHLLVPGGGHVALRLDVAEPDPACAWADPVVAAWCGDELVDQVAVEPGEADLTLDLTAATGDVHVYPPMHMSPRPVGVTGSPTETPVWLAYGDSITAAWSCPTPGGDWVSRASRQLGVEAVNLGFAGSARGEIAVATDIANMAADLVTVAFGTNCWTATPHSTAALRDTTGAFLTELRRGHPDVPVVVVSPIVRPAAENTPNEHGATLRDLRGAVESAVEARSRAGDTNLTLVPGLDVLPESGLCADLIHPGADGHAQYAEVLVPTLRKVLERNH